MMIFVFVGFSAELVEEVETDWSSEEHQKEQKLSTAHSCLQGDTFLSVLIINSCWLLHLLTSSFRISAALSRTALPVR